MKKVLVGLALILVGAFLYGYFGVTVRNAVSDLLGSASKQVRPNIVEKFNGR